MKYFAYGSNLCVPRLKQRRADPTNPRLASLPGHELLFNKGSMDGSTKANINPVSTDSVVWGVIFDISDDCLEGLREAEGRNIGHYTEESVKVLIDGELETVTTYIADPDKTTDTGDPYDWYLDHIVKGAETFGFPADYLINLRKVESIHDPDADRAAKERAYWHGPRDGDACS